MYAYLYTNTHILAQKQKVMTLFGQIHSDYIQNKVF